MPCVYLDVHVGLNIACLTLLKTTSMTILGLYYILYRAHSSTLPSSFNPAWLCRLTPFRTLVGMLPFSENVLFIEIKIPQFYTLAFFIVDPIILPTSPPVTPCCFHWVHGGGWPLGNQVSLFTFILFCIISRAWQIIPSIIHFDYSQKLSPLFPFSRLIILLLKSKKKIDEYTCRYYRI